MRCCVLVALFVISSAVLGCEEPVPCVDNQSCTETEVCVADECVSALGQEYALASASAAGIPQSHPEENRLWDMPGGYPDPYLIVEGADGWSCTTFFVTDTQTPQWEDLSCNPLVINESVGLTWTLYDDDERDGSEVIAALPEGEVVDIQAEFLNSGSFSSTVGDITVSFNVSPLQPEE